MIRGGLAKSLIRFSIPLVLGGILQQMYAWADAFVVGNLMGEGALAAIGATTALNNLFVMSITGLALGIWLQQDIHHSDNVAENSLQSL